MRIHPYKFIIDVIPGKENIGADALSRIPWQMQTGSELKNEVVCAFGEEEDEEFDEIEDLEELEVDQAVEPLITKE